MKQKKLIEIVLEKSKKIFPNLEDHENPTPDSKNKYFYFPALFYFKNNSIDYKLIKDLKNGKKLLSVGTGDAKLEQLLNKGFEIPTENITISDIELDKETKKLSFKKFQFDMQTNWENINQKFDYIIFPQSMMVALINKGYINSIINSIPYEKIKNKILKNKIKLEDETQIEEFIKYMEQNHENLLKSQNKILINAIKHLNKNGEIRVLRGIDSQENKAYHIATLLKIFKNIKFPKTYNKQSFYIKI